jgi:hypothetical protein
VMTFPRALNQVSAIAGTMKGTEITRNNTAMSLFIALSMGRPAPGFKPGSRP